MKKTAKVLGWIGVGVVFVVAAIWGVGLVLPVAHTARVSGEVTAPPDSVWAAVVDVESHPSWRPGVAAVERLETGPDGALVRWRETAETGPLTFEVGAWEPPRRMVARIADEGLPFGGSWTYELEPAAGGGTRVTLTEEGEVYDPFFRFFSHLVFGHESTLRAYLDALQGRFGPGSPS